MKKILLLCSALFALLSSFSLQGAIYGADAEGIVLERFGIDGATGGAGNPAETGNSDDSGGEGFLADTASGVDPRGRGNFMSAAALLPDLGNFSSLKTYSQETSVSGDEGYILSEAQTVEAFQWNGAAPATFSITIDLSSSLTPASTVNSDFLGSEGELAVIIGDAGNIFSYFDVIFGRYETWNVDDEDMHIAEVYNVYDADVPDVWSDSVTFTIDPGQTFIVYSRLFSLAIGRGSEADAYNTLDAGFTDGPAGGLLRDSGLVIPEPGALALTGFGGLLLLVARRRR